MVAKKATKKSVKKTARKSTAKKAGANKRASKKKVFVKQEEAQVLIDESTKKNNRSNGWRMHIPLVLLILGVLLLVAGVIYLLSHNPGSAVPEDAIVLVGDSFITQEQLDVQYASLPEQMRSVFSKEDILEELINEELVVLFAQRQGLSASEEEITQEIDVIIQNTGMTIEAVDQSLQEQMGSSLREVVTRKILFEKGLDAITRDVLSPSEEEALLFYEANQGEFLQARQVRVQHILVEEEALGDELLSRVRAGEDFCALVDEYSQDPGSISTCGTYTFGRGEMVAPFEETSFLLAINDSALAQTTFGFHIIRKIEDFPGGLVAFEEVRADILRTLLRERQGLAYQEFIVQAREDKMVVYR